VGAEIRRIVAEGQPWKKVSKTLSQPKKAGHVVYPCHPSYTGGINRRITVQEAHAKT
jgi:hypothetical protein